MTPNGVTIRKALEDLNRQGIHPTDEQLAEATGYQPDQIHNRLFLMRGDRGRDNVRYDESTRTYSLAAGVA